MSYEVKLKSYEGPMDLLLDLIKKNEIDIYDIPIAILADQFLDYISKAEKVNMDLTSDFILMATNLLQIKSKMLLPKVVVEEDEEEEDPREELVRKLLEYEKIKNASSLLKEFSEIESKAFYKKQEDLYDIKQEDFIKNCDINQLSKVFRNLMNRKTKDVNPVVLTIVKREKFTLDQSLIVIRNKLKEKKQIYFTDLLSDNFEREELIVYFLSLLEIVKNREAIAIQNKLYDNILIISRKRNRSGTKLKSGN